MGHVYTIGHSRRTLPELIELLQEYQISMLIDVRRSPFSKANPQFNRPDLESALAGSVSMPTNSNANGNANSNVNCTIAQLNGSTTTSTGSGTSLTKPKCREVEYRWCPQLGGSAGVGGKGIFYNLRMREGQQALDEILKLAKDGANVGIMCSEFDWKECHRQVIAQRLEERFPGIVGHIAAPGHPLCAHPRRLVFDRRLVETQGGEATDYEEQTVCPEAAGEAGGPIDQDVKTSLELLRVFPARGTGGPISTNTHSTAGAISIVVPQSTIPDPELDLAAAGKKKLRWARKG